MLTAKKARKTNRAIHSKVPTIVLWYPNLSVKKPFCTHELANLRAEEE
jgi:hypothetical protein